MLSEQISRLLVLFTGAPGQPPTPASVLVAEAGAGDFDRAGRPVLSRALLRTPAEYEGRFAELQGGRYSWINLTLLGLLDGVGLVLIEVPSIEASVAATPLNLSGPSNAVAASGWDVTPHVVLRP